MKHFKRGITLCITAAMLSFMLVPTSHAKMCATKAEKTALDIKAMQSKLMVMALSCDQQGKYNKFVKKFQTQLSGQKSDLQSYFKRHYKGGAKSALLKFTTSVSNEASQESLDVEYGKFCRQAKKIFSKLNRGDIKKLRKTASTRQFSSLHGIKTCKDQSYASK